MSLASRCFSGQLRILLGGWVGFFFPVETSSAACRRAGNSAEWLEQGSYPAVWLQAGALLSFCAPSVLLWRWWFFWHRQTRLCQMPRAHCTCSRVVDPERVAGLGLGPSSELGAICSWRLDLWPRWAASTAEMRIWHMAGLQDCSLFTALSACKYRSRVGLSVVQLGGCVLFRTVNITQLCLHNAIM